MRRDDWGGAEDASSFSGGRTGRMVHGTLCEATMELGSHGVIAT